MDRPVTPFQPPLGATLTSNGIEFNVWAPFAQSLELHVISPGDSFYSMFPADSGYWRASIQAPAGTLYVYRIDGGEDRPDPASRFQPQGVHGPSQVVDPAFDWTDGSWRGVPTNDYVIYELHAGTFTEDGTFDAVVPQLPYLRDLGVTAIELMPIAQFPGSRNWGYDSVLPYAVQDSYGGPGALRRLINECHNNGLAVLLDVVYNHLGPEGNYLRDFGPYFTDRYRTPWGAAINFDGPYSDDVRRYFIENALYWITGFHIDGLRLDAVHAIVDHSAVTFLEELTRTVRERARELGREVAVIAESDMNDARLVREPGRGGYGMDAVWSDDFHHSLHTILTGERDGYYQDFGDASHLAACFRSAFAYTGQYSVFRKRSHGSDPSGIPPERFVVFNQNHDQVGNRAAGERLTHLVSFEALKLAAAATILSPFLPLLFMGEEYGESSPFLYFVNHGDPDLVETVRRGRREEFAAFGWEGEVPDPQDEATFQRSRLHHFLRHADHHAVLFDLYRELISLRKAIGLPLTHDRRVEVIDSSVLAVFYAAGDTEVLVAFNLKGSGVSVNVSASKGPWIRTLDSAEERWNGPGEVNPSAIECHAILRLNLGPFGFAVYRRGGE